MPPKLLKRNCFVFAILFKLKHPNANIRIGWNSESRVVSFSVVYKEHRYHYRRKDRNQSKYWFNGRVVKKPLNKRQCNTVQN